MTNLINGKEALIALANGEEVENFNGGAWCGVDESSEVGAFLSDRKFRLKPRTIKLELEIPAPFEPKEGETYWFITDSECGYNCVENNEGCRVGIAAWRSEDEIKQVVAALRQVFGGV